MKKFCLLTALGLLACACEIPFSIDNISEPRFFVEFIPAAGEQTTTLKISYADPAYGEKPSGFYSLSSKDVSIEVNDKAIDTGNLTWEQNGNSWKAPVNGNFVPGDRITVSVKGASVPTATGVTVVPEPPVIASIDISKSDDKEESAGRRFVVRLDRNVAAGEYYGISIKLEEEYYTAEISLMPPSFRLDTLRSTYSRSPGQVASMSDINNMDLDAFASVSYKYGGLISEDSMYMIDDMFVYEYNPMSLLSNKQFDGNSYSFYINADLNINDLLDGMDFGGEGGYTEPEYPEYNEGDEPGDDWEDPEEPEEPDTYTIMIGTKTWYRIEIFRLSEEFYNYCKAQYLMDYNILANFGVTPPNFTYSNVRNGLGVVGGVSHCCSELIPDPFNKEPEMPNLMDLMKELTK